MLQSLSFDEKVERDASALIFVLFVRTFTFFSPLFHSHISCFLFISLLISSTLDTTIKYILFK